MDASKIVTTLPNYQVEIILILFLIRNSGNLYVTDTNRHGYRMDYQCPSALHASYPSLRD